MPTIGSILITIVLLMIVLPLMGVLLNEYGTHTATQNFANISNASYVRWNNSIYNPINRTVETGLNYSRNLSTASSIIGFSLAFILPNMVSIFIAVVQAPTMLASILTFTFQQIPGMNLPQVNCQPATNHLGYVCQSFMQGLITDIISLLVLFIGLVFFAIWSKYPVFGATG